MGEVSIEGLVLRIVERAQEILKTEGGEKVMVGDAFTPSVLDALACLGSEDYERFKVALEAGLLLAGVKINGLTERSLDALVTATRMKIRDEQSRQSTKPLVDLCQGAPGCEGLRVPPGWDVSPFGVARSRGPTVCSGGVYVAGRLFDYERGRTFLRVVAFSDSEWRQALVPVTSGDRGLVTAVKNLGVLVFEKDDLEEYLREFCAANWAALPVARVGVDEDSLFEAFRDFVAQHWGRFAQEEWGKVVQAEEGSLLAVLASVIERFCSRNRTTLRQALVAWRAQGWLASRSDLLRPVRFRGRLRRMAVFPLEMFDIPRNSLEGEGRRELAGIERAPGEAGHLP